MEQEFVVAGIGLLILLVILVLLRRVRSGGSKSKQAHEAAQARKPPVAIGETYQFGITEFTDHHSGERVVVGKVEGFVIFADNVPDQAEVGDVVKARVMSFNSGKTSADATVIDLK